MKDIRLILPAIVAPSHTNIAALLERSSAIAFNDRLVADDAAQDAPKRRSVSRQFHSSDLTRAIKAVLNAGQNVVTSEITREGTIRIHSTTSAEQEASPFDRWKARRDAGAA